MAEKVRVWFDAEGDYLEVQFRDAPGFMRPTAPRCGHGTCRRTGACVGVQRARRQPFQKGPSSRS